MRNSHTADDSANAADSADSDVGEISTVGNVSRNREHNLSMPQIAIRERNICSNICFDFEGEAVGIWFEPTSEVHPKGLADVCPQTMLV